MNADWFFPDGVKNAWNKYWWHFSFAWMKIYCSQETDLQAATNQLDYEIVVYVHHKTSPPFQSTHLIYGSSSTSKTFSNLVQTGLLLRKPKTFQGESCRLQYIRTLSLGRLRIPWCYMNCWSKAYYSMTSYSIILKSFKLYSTVFNPKR